MPRDVDGRELLVGAQQLVQRDPIGTLLMFCRLRNGSKRKHFTTWRAVSSFRSRLTAALALAYAAIIHEMNRSHAVLAPDRRRHDSWWHEQLPDNIARYEVLP